MKTTGFNKITHWTYGCGVVVLAVVTGLVVVKVLSVKEKEENRTFNYSIWSFWCKT